MSITTSEEIQYAINRRGTVDISELSTITTPIQLAHLEGHIRITNKAGKLRYGGPPGRAPFEWNWLPTYLHTPCKLTIEDVAMVNDQSDNSFIKLQGDKGPLKFSMSRIWMYAQRAYAVDANGLGDCESVWFEDIQTFGACAIRWRCNNTDGIKWGWIDSWRHFGASRIGAAFMFENCRNLLRDNLIDDGSPTLTSVLSGVYQGPIAGLDLNCSGHNRIDDFWFEPWGTWAVGAPGCWGFSVQVDEESGNHKPHVTLLKNISMNATGLEEGVSLFHFIGGGSSNDANAPRVQLEDQFDARAGDFKIGGKMYPVVVRPMTNSFWNAVDLARFNDLNANSFRDRWKANSHHLPSQTDADRVLYGGSVYQTIRTSEPIQP